MDTLTVVLDNGGSSIKAGMAGEDNPSVVLPTALGLEEFQDISDPTTFAQFIQTHRKGDLNLKYPIKNGAITNWDDMESIWSRLIEEHLKINPEETNLLITEPILNPRPAREKIAEILLEKLNFNGINIAASPVLALYAAGRTTGMVLNVGDGTTQVVPVWGGYVSAPEAMQRVDFGGQDVTQFLKEELVDRKQLHATSNMPLEVFKLIKEKSCYVAPDYDHHVANQAKNSIRGGSLQLP